MPDNNKVTVKIFGQQYTIAGTASSEDMELVAEHVDSMMNKLAKDLPSLSSLSLAVLTAVNAASEYYSAVKENSDQAARIEEMKKDTEHYSQLWEEAKSSLMKYQKETRDGVDQLKELQRIYNTKSAELEKSRTELDDLRQSLEDTQKQLKEAEEKMTSFEENSQTGAETKQQLEQSEKEKKELQDKLADLEKQLSETRNSEDSESQSLTALRDKYKELENNFFDIQMEKITLENELDEYKKQ